MMLFLSLSMNSNINQVDLCAGHHAKLWAHTGEQDRYGVCPLRVYQQGDQDETNIVKNQ